MNHNLNKGLYKKYNISKMDGSPVDPKAEYFLLRLDCHSNNPVFVAACRKAVLLLADEIADFMPELSKDLYEKYS